MLFDSWTSTNLSKILTKIVMAVLEPNQYNCYTCTILHVRFFCVTYNQLQDVVLEIEFEEEKSKFTMKQV